MQKIYRRWLAKQIKYVRRNCIKESAWEVLLEQLISFLHPKLYYDIWNTLYVTQQSG